MKLTLNLKDGDRVILEAIAADQGYLVGKRGNISALMSAIAAGNLKLVSYKPDNSGTVRAMAQKNAIAQIQTGLANLLQVI